jgi:hypothetical protein
LILPPPGNSGNLDLFTSGSAGQNETHIVFGGSGQISGQNNRFDRGTAEQGRLGTNNNWRFGANTSGQVFGVEK